MQYAAVRRKINRCKRHGTIPCLDITHKGKDGEVAAIQPNLNRLSDDRPRGLGTMRNNTLKRYPRTAGTAFHRRKKPPLFLFLGQSVQRCASRRRSLSSACASAELMR